MNVGTVTMTLTEADDLLDYIASCRAAMLLARPRVDHPWPNNTVLMALERMREAVQSGRRRGTREGRWPNRPEREGRPSTPRRQPSQVTP